jgi:hypothetical protein
MFADRYAPLNRWYQNLSCLQKRRQRALTQEVDKRFGGIRKLKHLQLQNVSLCLSKRAFSEQTESSSSLPSRELPYICLLQSPQNLTTLLIRSR